MASAAKCRLSKEVAAAVVVRLASLGVLRWKVEFTAYSDIAYLRPGRRDAVERRASKQGESDLTLAVPVVARGSSSSKSRKGSRAESKSKKDDKKKMKKKKKDKAKQSIKSKKKTTSADKKDKKDKSKAGSARAGSKRTSSEREAPGQEPSAQAMAAAAAMARQADGTDEAPPAKRRPGLEPHDVIVID